MEPGLRAGQVVWCTPRAGRPLRRGDVVLVEGPGLAKLHRVLLRVVKARGDEAVQPYVLTRGDWARSTDCWVAEAAITHVLEPLHLPGATTLEFRPLSARLLRRLHVETLRPLRRLLLARGRV